MSTDDTLEPTNTYRKLLTSTMISIAALAALVITYTLGISTIASYVLCFAVFLSQIFSCKYIWGFENRITSMIRDIHDHPLSLKRINIFINKFSIILTFFSALFIATAAFIDLSLISYGLVAILMAQAVTNLTGAKNSFNFEFANFFYKTSLIQGLLYLIAGLALTFNFFSPNTIGFLTPTITAYIAASSAIVLLCCRLFLHSSICSLIKPVDNIASDNESNKPDLNTASRSLDVSSHSQPQPRIVSSSVSAETNVSNSSTETSTQKNSH